MAAARVSQEAALDLGDDLYAYWERYRPCFRTRTRDTSENAYWYLRGQLTMEEARNCANIERRLSSGDGQALQQFMTDSPWDAPAVFAQIQADIRARPALQQGGVLILDESADEKAGHHSLGASRQYNGRLGKVDLCQVGVYLTYAHPATGVWALVDGELFLPEDWQHHTALTAAATWFVAEVKLNWRERYARDPDLLHQLEVEVLPALSTANVRELLQAVLPVPQFTPQQAREWVTSHLVQRARSTASRLRTQRNLLDSS